MPTVDFYSKGQTDTLLSAKANTTDLPTSAQLVPATSSASAGDVLTFDGSSIGWSAGGSGGGLSKVTFSTWAELKTYILAHPNALIIGVGKYSGAIRFNGPFHIETAGESVTLYAQYNSINSSSTKLYTFSIGSFANNANPISGRFAGTTIYYDGSRSEYSATAGVLTDFAISDIYAIV